VNREGYQSKLLLTMLVSQDMMWDVSWHWQDGTVLVHTVKHGLYLRTLKPPREKERHVSIEKLAVSNTGQIVVYCQHSVKSNSSNVVVGSQLD